MRALRRCSSSFFASGCIRDQLYGLGGNAAAGSKMIQPQAPRADFELPEGSVKDASTRRPEETDAARVETPITASHRQGELIFLMVRAYARQVLTVKNN